MQILFRLRVGSCTDEDYELLCSCIISKVKPAWNEDNWINAPVIVPTNEVKDVINICATLSFAEQTGRPVHWYHCIDKHSGKKLTHQSYVII